MSSNGGEHATGLFVPGDSQIERNLLKYKSIFALCGIHHDINMIKITLSGACAGSFERIAHASLDAHHLQTADIQQLLTRHERQPAIEGVFLGTATKLSIVFDDTYNFVVG